MHVCLYVCHTPYTYCTVLLVCIDYLCDRQHLTFTAYNIYTQSHVVLLMSYIRTYIGIVLRLEGHEMSQLPLAEVEMGSHGLPKSHSKLTTEASMRVVEEV